MSKNEPEWGKKPPDDHDLEDYAVDIVPCPHCDDNFVLGVYDPDRTLDVDGVTLMTLAHDGMQDDLAEFDEC